MRNRVPGTPMSARRIKLLAKFAREKEEMAKSTTPEVALSIKEYLSDPTPETLEEETVSNDDNEGKQGKQAEPKNTGEVVNWKETVIPEKIENSDLSETVQVQTRSDVLTEDRRRDS